MRKIAGALAGAGLLVAAFAGPASAAPVPYTVTSTLHPYIVTPDPAVPWGVLGIGSTIPNDPAGVTCLKAALDGTNAGAWLGPNASPSGLSTLSSPNVTYLNVSQTFTPLGSCTLNNTGITTLGKMTQSAGLVRFTAGTNASIDRGIQSSSSTVYRVTRPTGASVAVTCPATATCAVTNPTATTSLVTVTGVANIVSKSKLDTATCDTVEESDTTVASGTFAGTWTSSYLSCSQTAGQNLVKGTVATIDVTGAPAAGAVSLAYVKSGTTNVQLWDQTLGLCKVIDQASRVLQCKGAWGTVLGSPGPAYTINVRKGNATTLAPASPAGLNDPQGVTSPADIALIAGAL